MPKSNLVLLPGLLNTAKLWQYQIAPLQARYRVFFGDTQHQDRLESIAAAILQQLPNAPFALAGFSMGGYVALEMLKQAPSRITKLALLNSKAEPDTEAEQHQRQLGIRSAAVGRFAGVTPRLIRKLVHVDQHDNTALHQVVYDMAEEIGRAGFINQQTANLHRTDLRQQLAGFAKPLLLLSGSDDRVIAPATSFAIQDSVPQAKTILLDRVGHLSPLEAPEATTTALLDWLNET